MFQGLHMLHDSCQNCLYEFLYTYKNRRLAWRGVHIKTCIENGLSPTFEIRMMTLAAILIL
jgi:hypothetical protein